MTDPEVLAHNFKLSDTQELVARYTGSKVVRRSRQDSPPWQIMQN
jgi:hypothetical protein